MQIKVFTQKMVTANIHCLKYLKMIDEKTNNIKDIDFLKGAV